MKKVLSISLILIIVLLLTGCGKEKDEVDLNKTKDITFYDLSFKIPEVFTRDEKNSDEDIIFFDYDSDTESCMVSLSHSEYAEDDLKKAVEEGLFKEEGRTIEFFEKTVNGVTWSAGKYVRSQKTTHYYYVTNHNNESYDLGIDDFGSTGSCEKAKNIIVNSLKFN